MTDPLGLVADAQSLTNTLADDEGMGVFNRAGQSLAERREMSSNEEGPMTKAFRDVFDGIKCWAIHIEGPDDLMPVPSKNIGDFAAQVLNKQFAEPEYADLGMKASVIEWTRGYEAWKAGSEQFAATYANWIKEHLASTGA